MAGDGFAPITDKLELRATPKPIPVLLVLPGGAGVAGVGGESSKGLVAARWFTPKLDERWGNGSPEALLMKEGTICVLMNIFASSTLELRDCFQKSAKKGVQER